MPRASKQASVQLSDEEFARKMRPIMLSPDNIEYTLDDEQALELARDMRARTHVDNEESADSAVGTGGISETNTSRQSLNTGVFNGESRVNMSAWAHTYPWNMVGVMDGRCTVFKMINHYTAVTSAHCVYGNNGWKERRSLRFTAGSPVALGELPANCYGITVPGGWVSDVGDDEYDYAVIRLREGGASGAWCNYNDYNTGYFGYKTVSSCARKVGGNLTGYPGKYGPGQPPPGSWTYPSLFNDHRSNGWTSCVTYPNHLWYYNDNSGGQSGGPFWSNQNGSYRVRAINMSIWTGVFDNSNAGRRIDSDVLSFLKKYKGH